jgi:glucokinase
LERLRVIGVDLGGTKVLAAVISGDGAIEARLEVPTDASSQDSVLLGVDEAVEALRAEEPDVAGLGLGIPSRIDQRTGVALGSVNIPLQNVAVRDRMRERHGLPVAIDNDGNAAVIGEWQSGAAQGAREVVMLTLGTGVGGGLILDGKPYRGATGGGAELGHIVLELDGPPCGCGGRGHLESFAAGPAADRDARELYGPNARAGDTDALAAVTRIGRYLGAGIATFVNVFEPELIVIGGGFGDACGDLLMGPARAVLAQDGLAPARDRVRIVNAQLGVDAGVIGAGMIALEALTAEA